jgi:SpoIID/LytB domain protein
LYDIIPISRGVSGRIKEIEILGSKRNIIIRDEENIKQIFSNDKLYGTCFNVNFEVGNDGVPIEFTFKGAGYGQGVGMCLLGALVMAEKKYKCESILNHYYGNVSLKKVY